MSEQKYRQRGYRDSDRDDGRERRRGGGGPRPAPSGPRGRGLGKPTLTVFRCAVCGARQQAGEVKAEAVCDSCDADLHTCTHCTSFDTSVPNQCRQPITEPIRAKAKRNTCPHFAPKAAQESAPGAKPNDPKAAFDALFKF